MTQLAKLKWRCRRGMRELDLLLEEFLEQGYGSLSPGEQKAFERLLECPNQELMSWFMDGDDPQDRELAGIVDLLRQSGGNRG